jgi:hypothetical protein
MRRIFQPKLFGVFFHLPELFGESFEPEHFGGLFHLELFGGFFQSMDYSEIG